MKFGMKMNLVNLLMLVIILFLVYFFLFTAKEQFDQTNVVILKNPDDKKCSEKAINDAYTEYIFGTTKFVR